MVMMQARQLQDQAAKDSLQALRSRIYALGLVHQQLMASRDLQTFDIAPFLEELSGHIIEGGATESVQLVIDACTLNVNLDFAIPLGLLVTELVTNSLKHAFPNGKGTVTVTLEIGRASCRERVCQSVWISVGAVSIKKKKNNKLKQ